MKTNRIAALFLACLFAGTAMGQETNPKEAEGDKRVPLETLFFIAENTLDKGIVLSVEQLLLLQTGFNNPPYYKKGQDVDIDNKRNKYLGDINSALEAQGYKASRPTKDEDQDKDSDRRKKASTDKEPKEDIISEKDKKAKEDKKSAEKSKETHNKDKSSKDKPKEETRKEDNSKEATSKQGDEEGDNQTSTPVAPTQPGDDGAKPAKELNPPVKEEKVVRYKQPDGKIIELKEEGEETKASNSSHQLFKEGSSQTKSQNKRRANGSNNR